MKNCLVKEQKYNVLITNLPNNIEKDTVIEIAQIILRSLIDNNYIISTCDYIVDPNITQDERINFKVNYECIKDDHNFTYIFKK